MFFYSGIGGVIVRLLFILIVSVLSQQTFAINFFRCKTTSDCTMAYTGCGRYLSVHKRYKELYEAKARKGDTSTFCIAPTQEDKELRARGEVECRENKGSKKKTRSCILFIPKKS